MALLLPAITNLGDFRTTDTIYVPLSTYDASGGSVTLTGLAVTDIEIYKNGSTTQRSSDSGYALLDTDGIDFDGITGIHGFSIDLSDNTDAGFYANGAQYWLVISTITVATQTVSLIYYFTIGRTLVSVEHVPEWLTWKVSADGRVAKTITIDPSFTGTLAVDFGLVLEHAGLSLSAIGTVTGLTNSDVRLNGDKRQLFFNVAAADLSASTTYTIEVTATDVQGTLHVVDCTLKTRA